jgi:hypothetical protein
MPGEDHTPASPPRLALWLALLAPPSLVLTQMLAIYALSTQLCGTGRRGSLHLVAGLCTLSCLAALLLAWRESREARGAAGATEGAALDREDSRRFLAALGLMSGALFTLLALAQWFAVLVLDLCPP